MAIINLFSKRMAAERGEVADVYTYDSFSENFRMQLSMMVQDLLGDHSIVSSHPLPREVYANIVTILRKEYGLAKLARTLYAESYYEELHGFILKEPSVERCLDAIELCYAFGNTHARKQPYSDLHRFDANSHVNACLSELNGRFKEAGYGYEFVAETTSIIRIDSEFLHVEAVKPALHFLGIAGFEAARNEFFGAYEHYRHKHYKEALVDAGKSFESTCKVICKSNGWEYTPRDTASKLIQILIDKGFMPAYNQAHLSALQSVLSSGIPTLRNNLGGHGDGPEIVEVPPEVVAYGLHLTASSIAMLAALQAKRG